MSPAPHRRIVLAMLGAALVVPSTAKAAITTPMTVWKDPSCGCCGGWVDHVRKAGIRATVTEERRINLVKGRNGVPEDLWSCHTATIGGYVIEGHVPAVALERLFAERPKIKGLAVPGMPAGSPGMEVKGVDDETYEVIAFGGSPNEVFMRFRGASALPL